jgi:DNA-binding GntR family transcriptional regulator
MFAMPTSLRFKTDKVSPKGSRSKIIAVHGVAPCGTVYDRMKSDILSLALQPGQDLDEVSLSRRYGVSRTPIREALIRLATDHLALVGKNRRAVVTPLILADFPRFIEALDLDRRAVCRLAALRRHDADMRKIRAAQMTLARAAKGVRSGSDNFARRFAPLEVELHTAIAEAGHNGYLTRSYQQLLTIGHRMLHLPYAYDPRPGEALATYVSRMVARYADLAGAIEANDAESAETEARALTSDLVARLRSYFEENLTSGVGVASTD